MNKAYNTEFYIYIDTLCWKKGITHRELAEECGITEVTMSRYLRGERTLSLATFMRICKIFEIEPNDLYKKYLFSEMRRRVEKYKEEHEE